MVAAALPSMSTELDAVAKAVHPSVVTGSGGE